MDKELIRRSNELKQISFVNKNIPLFTAKFFLGCAFSTITFLLGYVGLGRIEYIILIDTNDILRISLILTPIALISIWMTNPLEMLIKNYKRNTTTLSKVVSWLGAFIFISAMPLNYLYGWKKHHTPFEADLFHFLVSASILFVVMGFMALLIVMYSEGDQGQSIYTIAKNFFSVMLIMSFCAGYCFGELQVSETGICYTVSLKYDISKFSKTIDHAKLVLQLSKFIVFESENGEQISVSADNVLSLEKNMCFPKISDR